MDYLQNLSLLNKIPLCLKDKAYMEYIEALYEYLSAFVRKSQPLLDYGKYEQDMSMVVAPTRRGHIRKGLGRGQAGGLGERHSEEQGGRG